MRKEEVEGTEGVLTKQETISRYPSIWLKLHSVPEAQLVHFALQCLFLPFNSDDFPQNWHGSEGFFPL